MKKLCLIVGIAISLLVLGCSKNNQANKIQYENYRTVRSSKVIIISPENRNIDDLKLLGEQLKRENASASIAWVSVFDDRKAADLFGDTSDWSEDTEKFYENHFIASYNKNNNTKLDQFLIHFPENEEE